MSSIRLFVLDAFARHGPTHGHRIRALAEEENVTSWTDVSVGSLYQAIKRLEGEGMLEELRVEQEGNYPARRVYGLTEHGRTALTTALGQELARVHTPPDPFDLALSRITDEDLAAPRGAQLLSEAQRRLALLRERERASAEQRRAVDAHLQQTGRWAYDHTLHRLRGEIAWHEGLVSALFEEGATAEPQAAAE